MTKATLKQTNTATSTKPPRGTKTSVADATSTASVEAPIIAKPRKKSTRTTASLPYAPDASKQQRILALLQRAQGASISELQSASGWHAHSLRGFLSATVRKKLQLPLVAEMRSTGERVYHIAVGESAHA